MQRVSRSGPAGRGLTAGRLAQRQAEAGLPPEAITRLILTHMRPDHIGGMLAGQAAVFPSAAVQVSDVELAFWTNDAASAPEGVGDWFELARSVAAAYGERITPFAGEADLGGGLSALPMPGHTPGHAGYRIQRRPRAAPPVGRQHVARVPAVHPPETDIVLDTDSVLAEQTRRAAGRLNPALAPAVQNP